MSKLNVLPVATQCYYPIADTGIANAGLLFPHASSANAQLAYDIVIMSHTADAPKLQYQAGLTFTGTAMQNLRKGSLAARGQPSDSVVGALHNLLLVTATALEKYQGNVLQDARAPEEIVGGVIDQALVLGSKKLKLFSGRD